MYTPRRCTSSDIWCRGRALRKAARRGSATSIFVTCAARVSHPTRSIATGREIFAEDFRFLFGSELATSSGTIENPDLRSDHHLRPSRVVRRNDARPAFPNRFWTIRAGRASIRTRFVAAAPPRSRSPRRRRREAKTTLPPWSSISPDGACARSRESRRRRREPRFDGTAAPTTGLSSRRGLTSCTVRGPTPSPASNSCADAQTLHFALRVARGATLDLPTNRTRAEIPRFASHFLIEIRAVALGPQIAGLTADIRMRIAGTKPPRGEKRDHVWLAQSRARATDRSRDGGRPRGLRRRLDDRDDCGHDPARDAVGAHRHADGRNTSASSGTTTAKLPTSPATFSRRDELGSAWQDISGVLLRRRPTKTPSRPASNTVCAPPISSGTRAERPAVRVRRSSEWRPEDSVSVPLGNSGSAAWARPSRRAFSAAFIDSVLLGERTRVASHFARPPDVVLTRKVVCL